MSTILELNNIKKAYDVKMAVDIDKLVIEDGDCVGLVGESGCGKSADSFYRNRRRDDVVAGAGTQTPRRAGNGQRPQ